MSQKSSVLIDLMPIFYASFYRTRLRRNGKRDPRNHLTTIKQSQFCTGDGVPVNAMRGTAQKLLEILSHPACRDAEYVGGFMDTPTSKKERKNILPSYKKRRKKTHPDLAPQANEPRPIDPFYVLFRLILASRCSFNFCRSSPLNVGSNRCPIRASRPTICWRRIPQEPWRKGSLSSWSV